MTLLRSKRSLAGGTVENVVLTPSSPVYAGMEYAIGAGGVMYRPEDLQVLQYLGLEDLPYKPLRDYGAGIGSGAIAVYGKNLIAASQIGCMPYNKDLDWLFWGWTNNRTNTYGLAGALMDRATGAFVQYTLHNLGTGQFASTGGFVACHILANGSIALASSIAPNTTQVATCTITVTNNALAAVTAGPVLAVAATNTGTATSNLYPNRLVVGNNYIDLNTFSNTTMSATNMQAGISAVWDGQYLIRIVGTTSMRIWDSATNTDQTLTLSAEVATGRLYFLHPGVLLHYAFSAATITIFRITYGAPHTLLQAIGGTVPWRPSIVSGPAHVLKENPKANKFTFYNWFDITVTPAGAVSNLNKHSSLSHKVQTGCVGWLPSNLGGFDGHPYSINTPVVGHFIGAMQSVYSEMPSPPNSFATSLKYRSLAHLVLKVVPALFLGELKAAYLGSPQADIAAGVPGNFLAELQGYKGAFTFSGDVLGDTLLINSQRCLKLRQVSKKHKPANVQVLGLSGVDSYLSAGVSTALTVTPGQTGVLRYSSSLSAEQERTAIAGAITGQSPAYTPQQFNLKLAGVFDVGVSSGLTEYTLSFAFQDATATPFFGSYVTIVDCLGIRNLGIRNYWKGYNLGEFTSIPVSLVLAVESSGLTAFVATVETSSMVVDSWTTDATKLPGLAKTKAAGSFTKE